MVTIVNYKVSTNEDTQETFISLVLEGDIELIQSKDTGRFYATARRALMSSTFTEESAALMVGKQLSGSIQKVSCEEYDYLIPETSEVIRLSHTYQFSPEGSTTTSLNKKRAIPDLGSFSTNGVGTKELVA